MRVRQEDGFTVVEMLVTVALVGVVLAVLLQFLTTATTITARADNNVRAERDGQIALRTATQDLRSASTISACASPDTYANCVIVEISKSTVAKQPCPKRVVTYRASGSSLAQTLTDYGANCTTITGSSSRTLMTGLTSTGIFTYYGKDGLTPLVLNNSSDLALLPKTPAIKVSLAARYTSPNAPVLTLASVATLRNNR
jgi:prepilin-type N-terminal cleavage/methylation domain-containing protein